MPLLKEQCLAHTLFFKHKAGIELMLGQRDKFEIFILSQKLCGRGNEYSTLFSAHNRESSSSSFEIDFVYYSTNHIKIH